MAVAREPTTGELADDLEKLTMQVQRLGDRFDNAPFVRTDLHNEQINNLRSDIASVRTTTDAGIAGVRTIQMWMLTILGTILVAVVVAVITGAAQT